MNRKFKIAFWAVVALLCPILGHAQGGVAGAIKGLQGVLDTLYEHMMPQCGKLVDIGRAFGGFGAMMFIAARIWRHLANAEPIDFYPLLRPFFLGFCIIIFPKTIDTIRGVMEPLSQATADMQSQTHQAIDDMIQGKEQVSPADKNYVGPMDPQQQDNWAEYADDEDDDGGGLLSGLSSAFTFALNMAIGNIQAAIRQMIADILEIVFQAAALIINTLRTFNLIIMAILGPIAFGLSIFDGFQHTVRGWLARYINFFLWLPVANIFGALIANIQLEMMKMSNSFFSATSLGYIVFMIIGILGYFTVPTIAGHIIDVGGNNALIKKATDTFASMAGGAGKVGGAMLGRAGQGLQNLQNAGGQIAKGYEKGGGSGEGISAKLGGAAGRISHFMKNRLSGK